ncbi:MAG: hypothetical protein RI911_491 [Candidatus Parcubacteria bacterium]|jgi:hypothetical protein
MNDRMRITRLPETGGGGGGSGGDIPVPTSIDAVEADPECAALLCCAYQYGARDADVAALVTANLKKRGSALVIPVTQIQGRLQKFLKESEHPDKQTMQRSRIYSEALKAKVGDTGKDAFEAKFREQTETVKNFLREHNAGAFWQHDETCTAFLISLLQKMQRQQTGTANDSSADVTIAGVAHALLDEFKLKTTHRSIEAVLQRRMDEHGIDGYLQTLQQALPAHFPIADFAARADDAMRRVHIEAYATRREDAEWMKRPEVVATVAALLVFKVPVSVSLSGRRIEDNDAVPLKSIGAIIQGEFGVHAWDASLRALVSRAGSHEQASAYLLKTTGITPEQTGTGTQKARELWDKYVRGIEERTFLQSTLFRNNDACACAYVLLTDTSIPLNALGEILKTEFEGIEVSRSLFQLMRARHVTREMAAEIIKHHKGEQLPESLMASYRGKVSEYKDRYMALTASAREVQARATRRAAARRRHAAALPLQGLTQEPRIPIDLTQAMPLEQIDAAESFLIRLLNNEEVSWARVRTKPAGNRTAYEIFLDREEELRGPQEQKDYRAFLHYLNLYGRDEQENRMYALLRRHTAGSIIVWAYGEAYIHAMAGKHTKVRGKIRVEIPVPYGRVISERGTTAIVQSEVPAAPVPAQPAAQPPQHPPGTIQPVTRDEPAAAGHASEEAQVTSTAAPEFFTPRHAQQFFDRIRSLGNAGSIPGLSIQKGVSMLATMFEGRPIMHRTLVIDCSAVRDMGSVERGSQRYQELKTANMFLTYIISAAERMKGGDRNDVAEFLESIGLQRVHITDMQSRQRGSGVVTYEKRTIVSASVPGA